jgi:Mor family transcriptional regulator
MNSVQTKQVLESRLMPGRLLALQPARERVSILDAIVDAIGDEAAAKLVAEFGGRRLYVPHNSNPRDPVARVIGADAALELARAFGGDRLVVPANFERAHRRERIIRAREHGRTITSIAREYHCTERYVYKVLAQARQG